MTRTTIKKTTKVTYKLKDKFGRRKKLWNENWFGGMVRHYLWDIRIPYLTGRWKYTITRKVK